VKAHKHAKTAIPRFIVSIPIVLLDEKTRGSEEGASGAKLNFGIFASQQTDAFRFAIASQGGEGAMISKLPTPAAFLTVSFWPGAGKRPLKVIPRDSIERRRDQFIRFGRAAVVLGLEALRFLDVIDRKFTQTVEFGILGEWSDRRQQVPGAASSAITSHTNHELLLTSVFPREDHICRALGRNDG
jgi:hypothetical protein